MSHWKEKSRAVLLGARMRSRACPRRWTGPRGGGRVPAESGGSPRSRYSPSVEQPLVPSLEQYRISILCLPTSSKFGSGRRALHVYRNRCS